MAGVMSGKSRSEVAGDSSERPAGIQWAEPTAHRLRALRQAFNSDRLLIWVRGVN